MGLNYDYKKFVQFNALDKKSNRISCFCLKKDYESDEKFKKLILKVDFNAFDPWGNNSKFKCRFYMRILDLYAKKNKFKLFKNYEEINEFIKENENVNAL